MLEKMQRTRNESANPGLRKRSKTGANGKIRFSLILLDVFSTIGDLINFWSYAPSLATTEIRLEYQQEVL